MNYSIIEDCSPYYIRYTHDGIQDILDYCNVLTPDIKTLAKDFTHYRLQPIESKKMLELVDDLLDHVAYAPFAVHQVCSQTFPDGVKPRGTR